MQQQMIQSITDGEANISNINLDLFLPFISNHI